ncbi:MAG: phenylalanine--tRNA ligase subunit beta [Firmicutes bacterium]|nr:phenylalanine--tRNA ligase subunit beta [Dethiobacter sp.]MBS3888366.1 phenylalanine--tRNA ligase subunit beta [Bacillota bacterium]MBS4055084.1 phenylalanine--tRNA ligase subunit beta [Thermaerobacter sp.]
MKVSYKWLQEYVVPVPPPVELGALMTAAGVAVDAVKSRDTMLRGAKTGRVIEVVPHSKASKLWVCTVDVGGETLTIVTGAENVKCGHVVPVAVPGTVLPNGKIIEPADFRGVMSYGMLLSSEEMGLDRKVVPSSNKDGIYLLPPETQLGRDVAETMGLLDTTLELDLTPNRSDCLSLLGVAQEVAALTNGKLLPMRTMELAPPVINWSSLKVHIDNKELCPAYLGLVVDNIVVTDSPLWMQNFLQGVGIKPINGIVDITNFVLWETGQPLHAFDYSKVAGQALTVRLARSGESIVTLDGEERALPESALVIADQRGAVAVAGVMGSLESEITPATKSIILESALFDRTSVRRTSRALGLLTAASTRFDKGVDPQGLWLALSRAAYLIEQLGLGLVSGAPVGCLPPETPERTVALRVARASSLLATDLTPAEMSCLLTRLGFGVTMLGDALQVKVPSRRRDVMEEIDLIEEVGRLHGFGHVPALPLSGTITQGQRTASGKLNNILRGKLRGLGMDEIMTLSFADPSFAERLGLSPDHPFSQTLPIQNPLSRERGVLRSTLTSGILEVLEYNQARQRPGMSIYEIGRVFLPPDGDHNEQRSEPERLCLGAFGERRGHWNAPSERLDYYFVKGVVESLLPQAKFVVSQHPFLHPGRQADIVLHEKNIGFLGELHPRLGLRERFVLCEIELEKAFALTDFEPQYKALGKHLPLERDLAFVLPATVSAAEVCQVVKHCSLGQVASVTVFDVYKGAGVPSGMQSMALRLELYRDQGSFTDLDLAELLQDIKSGVETTLGATLRGLAGS